MMLKRRVAVEGGIPPVESQRSRDMVTCQVAPPGGWGMNQYRHLVDMSYTSGALLRTSHELILSKFVRKI